MASIRDVAKLAGVSTSTVSVVLNGGDKYVSEGHKLKVLEAAKELDYHIPEKSNFKYNTIAVILPTITSSFFSNVLNGIETPLAPSNNMLFYSSNYEIEKERRCIEAIKNQKLSGVILDSVCPFSGEKEYIEWLKQELIEHNIPIVVLERNWCKYKVHSVYIDNYKAAYAATEHLLNKGHTKIAHIMGNEKMACTKERFLGYKRALYHHGIIFDPEKISYGDFTPYSGYVAMKKILDLGVEITALFSANDQMAIGAIQAIKASGRSVPRDIAVVGFDNISVGSMIDPALTTVNVPTYQMGNLAAKILLEIDKKYIDKMDNELKTNIIVRRSSEEFASTEWELFGW